MKKRAMRRANRKWKREMKRAIEEGDDLHEYAFYAAEHSPCWPLLLQSMLDLVATIEKDMINGKYRTR